VFLILSPAQTRTGELANNLMKVLVAKVGMEINLISMKEIKKRTEIDLESNSCSPYNSLSIARAKIQLTLRF